MAGEGANSHHREERLFARGSRATYSCAVVSDLQETLTARWRDTGETGNPPAAPTHHLQPCRAVG